MTAQALGSRGTPDRQADFSAFGIACERGQSVTGWVDVGQLNTGGDVRLPVRLLRGTEDGPVVGMGAMVHGDEVNGYGVVNRLFDGLDPTDVRGTLIGLPVANPFALATNQRSSSFEYERLNLNRVFPGNPNGFQIERLADLIFREGVLRCDVWLDFHEGGRDFMARYLIVGTEGVDGAADNGADGDLTLARWFGQGVPVTIVTLTPEMERLGRAGAVTVQARLHGKRALGIELGGGGILRDEYVATGVQGTIQVLRGLGVLGGGEPTVDETQHVCHVSKWVRPAKGGFFDQFVALGDVVEAGAPVGRVRDLLGVEVEVLKAPYRSVIIDTRHTATIQTGEWALKCARIPDASTSAERAA
jgi:predicted deacylase